MEVITCMLQNDNEGTLIYSEERRERVIFAKVVQEECLDEEECDNDDKIELLIDHGKCVCHNDALAIRPGTSGVEWADHVCIVRVILEINEP